MNNLVSSYVRQWLELPISSTLSTLVLPNEKCGLGITLPSTKFIQCQTVIRNALKSSPSKTLIHFGPRPALVAIFNTISSKIQNKY